MERQVNRAIELLRSDQGIYYTGAHTGHVLTYAQGREDAGTWADYINIGMEHGAFDMAGLADYLRGMADAGPTRSGHRTPTVIVEAPVNGIDEAMVRANAWQFRQILGRGAHGVLLCQAECASAAAAFVESCRYPHHTEGVDAGRPTPATRMRGEVAGPRQRLGLGTRGRGSEATASAIWGVSAEEYMRRCDPWPLNSGGELLLGVKLESPEGVANCEAILAVPGLGFAEMGPGDLSLALGYVRIPSEPFPLEMQEARERIFAACRANKLAFLEACTPETIESRLDEGVRVIAGGRADTAERGRAHQRRTMKA